MKNYDEIIALIREKIRSEYIRGFKDGLGTQSNSFSQGQKHGYDSGYRTGYDKGYKDGQESFILKDFIEMMIDKGRQEAWECARKISKDCFKGDGMSYDVFGYNYSYTIFDEFEVSDAIAKIKEYEQMRDATPEERESVYDYIESISEECSGEVNFWDGKDKAKKHCADCKWLDPTTPAWERHTHCIDGCTNKSEWEPKEKDCRTCRYEKSEFEKDPCFSCSENGGKLWEPKDSTGEWKKRIKEDLLALSARRDRKYIEIAECLKELLIEEKGCKNENNNTGSQQGVQ